MATTIPAGTLRLLLTSIGYRAKARKEKWRQVANGSASPAAFLLLDCPAGHGSITGRTGAPCIHYYNKRLPCPVQRPVWRWYLVSVEALRLTVCPPAWHRWCIGGLCGCCIVCTGIGQINGNAAVKLRKRFLRFGRIICINGRRTAVNACKRLTRRLAKRKALHPQKMQGKRKAPPAWAGSNLKWCQR